MFEDFVPRKAQSNSMEIASEKKATTQVRTIIYVPGGYCQQAFVEHRAA